MITNQNPVLHADFSDTLKATPHLQEGKFGKLDINGKLALAATADEALGIICNPDGHNVAVAGNATSADLCLRTFGGIIEAQVGTLTSGITCGQQLALGEDGRLTDSEGTPVAMAVEGCTSTTAGQLVRVVMLPYPAETAESEGTGTGTGSGE